jgi:AcrR family transcriptional regulator
MDIEINTEQRIKDAAVQVFMEKGMYGARMQDIADAASINKAMLHYYFRTKKKLFEIVYQEQFFRVFQSLGEIIFTDLTFEEKIPILIKKEIALFSKIPVLPLFILHEGWHNIEVIHRILEGKPIQLIRAELQKSINDAVKRKVIRQVKAHEVLINIMSLVIYPFIAKPIITSVFCKNEKEYHKLMKNRDQVVTQIIMQSLKPESI